MDRTSRIELIREYEERKKEITPNTTFKEMVTIMTPPSWKHVFIEAKKEISYISTILKNVKNTYTPTMENILIPFWYTPFDQIKMIIVNDAPKQGYDTDVGLSSAKSYSLEHDAIYKTLESSNISFIRPKNGDLRGWCMQGVLFINLCMTRADVIQDVELHKCMWEGLMMKIMKEIINTHLHVRIISFNKTQNKLKNMVGEKCLLYEVCSVYRKHEIDEYIFSDSTCFVEINKHLHKCNKLEIEWNKTNLMWIYDELTPDIYFQLDDPYAEERKKQEKIESDKKKLFISDKVSHDLMMLLRKGKIDTIAKSKQISVPKLKIWAQKYHFDVKGNNKKDFVTELSRQVQLYVKTHKIIKDISLFYETLKTNVISNVKGENPYDHLKEHGWGIFPLTMDHDMIQQIHDTTSFITKNDTLPLLPDGQLGGKFVHSTCMWNIRAYCFPIFKELWKTESLTSSFQSGLVIPYEENKLHLSFQYEHPIDCNQFCNVFGVVCLYDITKEDEGLVLLENSHLFFDTYIKKQQLHFPNEKIPVVWSDELIKNAIPIKIICPKNSLILFDTRMMYTFIGSRHKKDKPYIFPLVSMGPSYPLTDKERKNKKLKSKQQYMTNHWHYEPCIHYTNPKNDNTWNFIPYDHDLMSHYSYMI